MLPPGHIAGGFLAAYGLLKITKPDLAPAQVDQLLWLGAFFGFAPDLDYFVSFFKERSLTVRDFEKNTHRQFISHAPLVWLAVGLLIYFLASSIFVKYLGLVIWLGSWTHFIADSVEYGVMWLWPFSTKYIGLIPRDYLKITEPGFWRYWVKFVKLYTKAVSFYLEILVIIVACYILIRLF